jgi:hypothetical protein
MIGTSKMVSFLYGTILGRCFLKIIMKLHLDRGIVRFLWSPYSKHLIEWYIRYNGIAVTPEERASFRSFREFFARTRADIQAVSRQAGHHIIDWIWYVFLAMLRYEKRI